MKYFTDFLYSLVKNSNLLLLNNLAGSKLLKIGFNIVTHPLLVSPIRLSSSPEVSKVSGGHDKAGTASSVLAPLPPVLPARLGIDVFSTEYNKKPVSMKQRLSIAQNYGIKNIPISGSLLDVGAHI